MRPARLSTTKQQARHIIQSSEVFTRGEPETWATIVWTPVMLITEIGKRACLKVPNQLIVPTFHENAYDPRATTCGWGETVGPIAQRAALSLQTSPRPQRVELHAFSCGAPHSMPTGEAVAILLCSPKSSRVPPLPCFLSPSRVRIHTRGRAANTTSLETVAS